MTVVGTAGPVSGAAAVACCVLGTCVAAVRWLRVAQREHYLPGSATRFALRWWRSRPVNVAILVGAVAGVAASHWWALAALASAVAGATGPIGLGVRGRTAPLAWTRRLRTLTAVVGVLAAAAVVVGCVVHIGPPVAAAVVLLVPVAVDAACAITSPVEHRIASRYVGRATERLRRVRPTVVAVTGSYGKTSTKGYVAHLLEGSRSVVATPASFNNRAGLSRAVNEHLAEGTDVFVAEMGTYGPGEIAELCTWVPPDVAVITAIGPVHLERFGSEERILAAKAEILVRAPAVVLPVDDERLAALADRCQSEGKRVWRCSTTVPDAPVAVIRGPDGSWRLWLDGVDVGATVPDHCHPPNAACAVAVALDLGVSPDDVAARLATLPTVAHRLEPAQGPGGSVLLDDTYNANPAGAQAALARLTALGCPGGRRLVVTPGMVELGRRQEEENTRLGETAGKVATDLVIVGRTNRRALQRGASAAGAVAVGPSSQTPVSEGACRVLTVVTRGEAVAWVRDRLGPGDVVLYENDLPDHYP